MPTSPQFVEKQWEEYQKNNSDIKKTIDENQLKETLIQDLTYASKMDVREYTLYQKWCEIHEKYPIEEGSTLSTFFDSGESEIEDVLVYGEQENYIKRAKNNIWIPKDADDFDKLKPKMVLYNGSKAEEWNTIRTFTSTMKNNSNIGRNLYYIVQDSVTEKHLGVICISSDFLDLTPRDNTIGWSRDIKTQQGMINHTAKIGRAHV